LPRSKPGGSWKPRPASASASCACSGRISRKPRTSGTESVGPDGSRNHTARTDGPPAPDGRPR
jgi:hypothetical protein